jgi:cation transport regulator ChaC
MDDGLWIFGYGSLVWRPAFEHLERRSARLPGWSRRFWQGSPDHRGVPGEPGRVVTLVRDSQAVCWGMAFRVAADRTPDLLHALDLRESGGFVRIHVTVRLDGAGRTDVSAVTYVAEAGNPNYLGPAPPAEMVEQIRRARGTSGTNLEYVLRLAEALRALAAEDEHVFELARLLGED